MKDSDWILIAYCRSCGIDGVVDLGVDRRIVWPVLIHEANCELAEPDDPKELRESHA